MTRGLRSVLRLSLALRNLPSTNQLLSLRLLHSSSALDARFNRPVFASEVKPTVRALDIHEDVDRDDRKISYAWQLKACRDQDDLLQLVEKEHKNMSGFQALKALQTLFEMEKQNPRKTSNDIKRTPQFAKLCDTLKLHLRQLSPGQVTQAIKCLTYVQVPASTVIMQELLQMIRSSVNQLSMEEILFLMFLLQKCQKTHLVEALTIALPIVFEAQVNTKLDSDNLDSLINILQYLRKHKMHSEVIHKIFHILESRYCETATPEQAKQIFFCLLDWESNDTMKILLPKMMETLATSIDELTDSEMAAMLRRLEKIFTSSKNADLHYHEGFADACGASIISKDRGFLMAQNILTFYLKIEHTNIALLDYISGKCFEDPSILRNADKIEIGRFLFALTHADYKPVYWDTIKASLISEKLLDNTFLRLNRCALHLTQLDCYFPKIIAETFTRFDVEKAVNLPAKKRFLLLYYAVQDTFPEYNGPWPSEDMLRICSERPPIGQMEYPLRSAIECALGGPQYVASALGTKFGYYVDHVVIMRKGGFPIAINNPGEPTPEKIEDLQPPPDSQVLLFMNIPTYGCPRNSDRLTGYWSLLIRQLEAKNKYTVIPVISRMWQNMSEQEQIRYISQAIRLKSDELSAIVN